MHIWWLDLGREGTEIVAAGLLIAPDPDEATPRTAEQRHPIVGTTADGVKVLAYLAREHNRAPWALWLTSITHCGDGAAPFAPSPAGRKLAEGCVPVAPAFSADGRWVYAARCAPGSEPRLERFAVTDDDCPRSR
jgi:hypothetical protein